MPTATKEKAEPQVRTITEVSGIDSIRLWRMSRTHMGMRWPCGDRFDLSLAKLDKLFDALEEIKAMKSPLMIGVSLDSIERHNGLMGYWVTIKGPRLQIYADEFALTTELSYAKLRSAIDQVKIDPVGEPDE